MLKTIAMVMAILLLAGIAPTFANELEVTVLDQRPVTMDDAQYAQWVKQLEAGKMICPTIQEIYASRTAMAMGGVSTTQYTAARDAVNWLARCRAQVEWSLSMLRQTPEGRAYLARVINERLRLEYQEGPYLLTECAGGCGGGGPISIIVDTDRNRENQWTRIQTPTVSPTLLTLALILGMGTIQMMQNNGWITPAQANAMRAELGLGIGIAIGLGLLGGSRDPER